MSVQHQPPIPVAYRSAPNETYVKPQRRSERVRISLIIVAGLSLGAGAMLGGIKLYRHWDRIFPPTRSSPCGG